jgi:flagellar biogenesis protein FliO
VTARAEPRPWRRRTLGAAALGLVLLAGVAASRLLPEVPAAALPRRAASADTNANANTSTNASAAKAAPALGADAPRPLAEPSLDSTRSSAGILLFGVLTIGAIAWWRRRHTTTARPAATLELLAQSSLGGRARALWLRAEERNLLVAVTPQAVQLLDRWPRPAARAAAHPGDAHRLADDDGAFDDQPTGDFALDDDDVPVRPSSPASSSPAPAPSSLVHRINAAPEQRFARRPTSDLDETGADAGAHRRFLGDAPARTSHPAPARLAARTGPRTGRRHRRSSRARARLGCARDQEPR